jgi:hypothetical protein
VTFARRSKGLSFARRAFFCQTHAMRFLVLAVPLAVVAIACSSHHDSGYPILDAEVACQQEQAWPKLTSGDCTECITDSQLAECGCPTGQIPQRAQCQNEATTRATTAGCSDVPLGHCIEGCMASDCACKDACYQAYPQCRAAQGTLDSCVIHQCESVCNPT